jgi:hypothetical protein
MPDGALEAVSGLGRSLWQLRRCSPGTLDRFPCSTGIVAMLDVDLPIGRGREPVSRARRYIILAAANDEQMITDQAVFDAVLVKKLENLRVVVLVDLNAGFHAIASYSGEQKSRRDR